MGFCRHPPRAEVLMFWFVNGGSRRSSKSHLPGTRPQSIQLHNMNLQNNLLEFYPWRLQYRVLSPVCKDICLPPTPEIWCTPRRQLVSFQLKSSVKFATILNPTSTNLAIKLTPHYYHLRVFENYHQKFKFYHHFHILFACQKLSPK